MQRYKCNTKEKKKHICWENTWTKNGGQCLVVKAFVDLIYLYTFLKIRVLVSSERSV